MKLEFTITVELPEDSVFAPAVDGKFLAGELAGFTTALMGFYSASETGTPEISVSVPEIPEPTKVTIV